MRCLKTPRPRTRYHPTPKGVGFLACKFCKKYGLATVKIGTIGYVHDIPSLPLAQATEITQRITALSDRTSRKEPADATGTTHDFR